MSASESPNGDEVQSTTRETREDEIKEDGTELDQKISAENQDVVNGNGEDHHQEDGDGDSDSEDFGNFSDASFEPVEEEITPEKDLANVEEYLDRILPVSENIPKELPHSSSELEALIADERPKVIYEQLVLLRTVLKPFIWDRSHIKSNLWHILRIPERIKPIEQNVGREPLDDRLFTALCNMLQGKRISPQAPQAILRDQLGIIYSPPLAPVFLQEEFEKQREGEIPQLLTVSPDEVEDLRAYHDKLCHSIDLLLLKLQESRAEQVELVKDKTTFENVVTNLTGHTQRLYRDEVALYNKHKGKKKSRFSWVGH